MRIVQTGQRAYYKWFLGGLGLFCLMGASCDSGDIGGLGGVGNILNGVYQLVIGILQLVD